MRQLTVGSLFSGIGGFDLGLERAGMRVIWQSEIDPYASAVLRKHWPDVPNLGDVCGIRGISGLVASGGNLDGEWYSCPDVICGGFPCQDISNAGKRAGIDGERSGLWSEFARIIGDLRPRYVMVENVAALLGRGLERVLGDLAALGYDAEWHCIPASAVGAPHRRDRVWIVASSYGERWWSEPQLSSSKGARTRRKSRWSYTHLVNPDKPRLQGWLRYLLRECADQRAAGPSGTRRYYAEWWSAEPNVGRVANGVPARVDRLRCLGNAIVPQIAEIIGRAIVQAHHD